jgi:superfamily II DNA/RNA helicase
MSPTTYVTGKVLFVLRDTVESRLKRSMGTHRYLWSMYQLEIPLMAHAVTVTPASAASITLPETTLSETILPESDLSESTLSENVPDHVMLDTPHVPTFVDLGLPASLVEVLKENGITAPFPIQAAAIADALSGRDTLGRGRTGSGKTLAFVLPTLVRLDETSYELRRNCPRAVILVPTRELANQVRDVLAPYARHMKLRYTTIYGGVSYNPQITALRDGVDIVVACPGRFVDLMESGHVHLDDVEVTILDEADHMAELGFLEAVTRILKETPETSQRLLFSATLDRGIDTLVKKFLHNPITHEVDPEDSPVDAMSHHVFHVDQAERLSVITDLCQAPGRALVFTRTKHGARKLTEQLIKAGVPSVELHGNLSQAVRAKNLQAFSTGKADTLVATDIAARGIHVDDIALVIHADPPEEHKAFLHRSGRTARAGAEGTVVTMMTDQQRRSVKRLMRDAGITATITKVDAQHPMLQELAPGERVFKEMPSLDEPRRERSGRERSGRERSGRERSGGERSGNRDRSGGRGRSDNRGRSENRDRSERSDGPRGGHRDRNSSGRSAHGRSDGGSRGPKKYGKHNSSSRSSVAKGAASH